jgi:hypothetical protein
MSDHTFDDAPASAYRDHATQLIEEAGQAQHPESRRSLFDIARWYAVLAAHVERRALAGPVELPLRRKGI